MRALVLLVLAGFLAPLRAAALDLPPVEAFFSRPKLQLAALSPSGRWLAVTAPAGTGRLALAVVDSDGKQAPQITASFSNADVVDFNWIDDERLVFSVGDLQVGYSEQRFGSGVYAVKRDGTEQRRLDRSQDRYRLQELLAVPRGGAGQVVMGEYLFGLKGDLESVDANRVDVATGRIERLSLDRPAHTRSWLFDPSGEPRAVVASSDGTTRVFWRGPSETAWRLIASSPVMEAGFTPVAVDGQGRLYGSVIEAAAGTSVLTRFDFAAGKPSADVLARTPGFDFSGQPIFAGKESRLVGLRLLTDAATTVWFEPAMKRIQATVDARLPGHVNIVSCADCSAPEVVLVNSYSDQDPGAVYVYRPGTDEWHTVGQRRPDIDPAKMARLDLHRIKTRDGREMPVWVTTPKGMDAKAKAPAIVLVHGGPQARGSSWHWEAQAQFLASRGYVVIEPEFRGSEGYGRSHMQAGWRHWGDTMQDDNADALAWAVGQGLVDPKRACIAGASYGGYATLMSLIRHPDTYRCGVAWAAVTDPRLLFNEEWASDLQTDARQYYLPEVVGDLVRDADMLRRSAPVERAGEIKVPVLLAFGRDDRRVPIQHGVKMRSAMTAAGHPPEWIVYEGEGHGWRTTEHQLDFWRRVEAFLAAQLKPGG